ncbi:MAG: DNA repair protein RecO [Parcubacteria group bacterium]|nr:DNA repair protein RecO [Parcubacteria group bacterium]
MYFSTSAILLESETIGENDKRYIFLTKENGKMETTIKGGSKVSSKLRAQLSWPGAFTLYCNKAKNFHLIGAEAIEHLPQSIQWKNWIILNAINELCILFTHGEPQGRFFDFIMETEKKIARAEHTALIPLFLAFLIKSLHFLGFGPHLSSCLSCKKKVTTRTSFVYLDIAGGGIQCENCYKMDITTHKNQKEKEKISVDQFAQSVSLLTKPYNEIKTKNFGASDAKIIFSIIKKYIYWHLGEMKSLKIVETLL